MNYIRAACFATGLILLASAGNWITAAVGGLLLGTAIFILG